MKFKLIKEYYQITDPALKKILKSKNYTPGKTEPLDHVYSVLNEGLDVCDPVYFEKTPELMAVIHEYQKQRRGTHESAR